MWVFLAQLSIFQRLVCAGPCGGFLILWSRSRSGPGTLCPNCSALVPSSLCLSPGGSFIASPLWHSRTVLLVLAQNIERAGHDTGVCLKSLFIPQTRTSTTWHTVGAPPISISIDDAPAPLDEPVALN